MSRLPLLALFATLALTAAAAAQPSRVSVAGDAPRNGIFDPSLEFAPGASEGWLSYSAVFGTILPWGPHVETHLARSTDSGATWTFDGVVNASFFDTITLSGGGTQDGVWNYEVSSLVHDPADTGAEWKLFAHRIFRKTEDNFTGEQNLPAYSWIVLRTASHPTGPWSAELALLSSGIFPPPPYDNVQVSINALDPSLASLIVYSEPGAFVQGGTLYLSLTGLTASGPDRIVLLASDDHAATWRYVGTPLTSADATALGFLSFDGSAIVEDAGRVFLLATPESPGVLHDGTLVLPFDDLSVGSLERSGGVPVIEKHLPAIAGLPLERRGGQADFHAGAASAGILQPSLQVGDYPEIFQFFATGAVPSTPAVPSLSRGGVAALLLLMLLAVRHGTRARRLA
jgi:hypothetical protein